MSTNAPIAPSRQLIDAVVDMYVTWREACAAVDACYHRWTSAAPAKRASAFAAYVSALDREERVAGQYRLLLEQVHPAPGIA